MIDNSYVGSALDNFLDEDGILAEVNAITLKRVQAWQILQETEKRGLSQSQW